MWKFLKKHSWLFTLLIIILLFPQSLSNQAKLSMKTIIPGMAIDRADNMFEVTALVVTPTRGSESGGGELRATYISEKGETIADAVEKLGFVMGKSAGLANLNYIIIGKSICEQNIVGQLDYFIRDKKTSNSILVLTCENEAKEEIKKTEMLEASTGIGLQKVFLYKQQSTNGYMMPILEVANSIYTKSKACLISNFTIEESKEKSEPEGGSSSSGGSSESGGAIEKPDGRIKYLDKMVCFVNGYKVGELENDEVLGYLMLDNSAREASINLGEIEFYEGNAENFNIKYYGKTAKRNIGYNGEKILFNVDINLNDVKLRSLNMSESPSVEFYKEANKQFEIKIKEKIKEVITKNIQAAFDKGKSIGCDIYKLSDLIYQTKYDLWKKCIENNENYLNDIKINVNVKIDKLT